MLIRTAFAMGYISAMIPNLWKSLGNTSNSSSVISDAVTCSLYLQCPVCEPHFKSPNVYTPFLDNSSVSHCSK